MAYNKKYAELGESVIDYVNNREDAIEAGFDDVQDLLLKINPVGTIYTSVNDTNPSTFIGGEWEEFGKGRVLVGVDESQSEFNTVQKTGGAKTHKLTIDEMPSHRHTGSPARVGRFEWGTGPERFNIGNFSGYPLMSLNSEGGDNPHNNLQPYITVYRFIRVS